MATLQDSDIADLIAATRQDYGDDRFNDIASRLTDYEVMGYLLQRDKRQYQSGKHIQGNLLTDHSNSASMTGLHQVIEPSIPDLLEQFQVPWRHTNYHWSWERREALMNRGASQIVDLLTMRRAAAKISSAELMETQFWNEPASSTNTLDVFGVPYWVVKASSATAGFNGGNPTGFTAGAGSVDSTVYTRWKNWNARYTKVTEDDALREMRKAYRRTNFKSPVTIHDYAKGKGNAHRIYMNESTIDAFEVEARVRNDDHGGALDKFMDATSFKKSPLRYVPKLDSDTGDPIYMLDMNYFCLVFLKGDYFYEHDPMRASNQPNTWTIFVDTTWNVLCSNRRKQAVIDTGN